MNPDPWRRRLLAAGAVGLALLTAACATGALRDAPFSTPGTEPAGLHAGGDPLRWAIDYHNLVQRMDTDTAMREWTKLRSGAEGDADVQDGVIARMRRAILLAHPRAGNPQSALPLLASVLASKAPEAVALHPIAHLLSQQLAERQRLELTAERLTRQLERTGQALKESRRRNERLEEKLEALTEIERSLPARPPAAPLPTMPDRRN